MAGNKALMKTYSKSIANFQTGMSADFEKFVSSSLNSIDDPLKMVNDPFSNGDKSKLFIYMRDAYPQWTAPYVGGAMELGNSFYQLRRAEESSKGKKLDQAAQLYKVADPEALANRLLPFWTATGMVQKVMNSTPDGQPYFFGEVSKGVSGRIGDIVRDVSDSLYRNDNSFLRSRVVPSPGACAYCMDIVASFERSYARGKSPSSEDVNFHDHCNCVIDWE